MREVGDTIVTLKEVSDLFGMHLSDLHQRIDEGEIKAPERSLTGRAKFYLCRDMPELGRQLGDGSTGPQIEGGAQDTSRGEAPKVSKRKATSQVGSSASGGRR